MLLPLIANQQVFISCISSMELVVGATNKADLKKIKTNISAFQIVYIDLTVARIAIELLEKYNLSHGLQIQDSFVVATALATSLPLFTYNVKDFSFINGLELFKAKS